MLFRVNSFGSTSGVSATTAALSAGSSSKSMSSSARVGVTPSWCRYQLVYPTAADSARVDPTRGRPEKTKCLLTPGPALAIDDGPGTANGSERPNTGLSDLLLQSILVTDELVKEVNDQPLLLLADELYVDFSPGRLEFSGTTSDGQGEFRGLLGEDGYPLERELSLFNEGQ